jgi:hypothetical protein
MGVLTRRGMEDLVPHRKRNGTAQIDGRVKRTEEKSDSGAIQSRDGANEFGTEAKRCMMGPGRAHCEREKGRERSAGTE